MPDPASRPAAPTTPRQAAFVTMRDAGVPVRTAASVAGYSPSAQTSYVYTLDKRRRQGMLPSLVSDARKALKALLRGQAVGKGKPPSADTISRVGLAVLERTDPVVHRVEASHLHGHALLTPEKRARLEAVLGLPPALTAGTPEKSGT